MVKAASTIPFSYYILPRVVSVDPKIILLRIPRVTFPLIHYQEEDTLNQAEATGRLPPMLKFL